MKDLQDTSDLITPAFMESIGAVYEPDYECDDYRWRVSLTPTIFCDFFFNGESYSLSVAILTFSRGQWPEESWQHTPIKTKSGILKLIEAFKI